jgi:hypothetical protein
MPRPLTSTSITVIIPTATTWQISKSTNYNLDIKKNCSRYLHTTVILYSWHTTYATGDTCGTGDILEERMQWHVSKLKPHHGHRGLGHLVVGLYLVTENGMTGCHQGVIPVIWKVMFFCHKLWHCQCKKCVPTIIHNLTKFLEGFYSHFSLYPMFALGV